MLAKMWSRQFLVAICGLAESLLADWQQIDTARSRPVASLLLTLSPPCTRNGRPSESSHSSLRAGMPMATFEEVRETNIEDKSAGSDRNFSKWFSLESSLDPSFHTTFSGVIKVYFPKKKYGFVSCPEVTDKFGRDAFIMKSDMGSLRIGDKVAFNLEDNNGLPKATNIRLQGKSIVFYEAHERKKAVEMEILDAFSIIDEFDDLADSFARIMSKPAQKALRDKWETSVVFRASADASDLDTEQRLMLASEDGGFFTVTTQRFDVDFVRMDDLGTIFVYGRKESRVRKAMDEVLWQVAYFQHWRKVQREQLAASANGELVVEDALP